ncbi:MAG: twin-arginine translocase subunit TatC [Pontiellaceae bacterium]|nr:twin-arginine translocase subunit TatC [Pontiellaceae bacterium]MBN2786514.1 twin-arginine translocase subunit TatC [Pontiellaceae bacterium]
MKRAFDSFRSRFRYDDREMPFLEHLEEFRKMLIRSAVTIVVGMILCAYFVPWMTDMLLAPGREYVESGRIVLQLHELPAGFKMWFTLAFWSGVIVSMPMLMMIVGSFVLPGVKDSERCAIQRIGFFSGILFVVGVVVGYEMTLPMAINLLLGVNERLGGANILHYQKYIDFTLHLLLGFGVAFQLPVVIITLGRLGFLTSAQLREKRRHVIVGLFVLAMLLTPPDWMTQVQMAIPLILLYEFCIWFLYFTEKGKRRRGSGRIATANDAGAEEALRHRNATED